MNRYSGGQGVLHAGTFAGPLVGLGLVTAIYDPMPYSPNLAAILSVWVIGLGLGYVMIAVHELGHVVAGRLMGIEIASITIGHWRRVFSFRVGTVDITVRAAPSSGYVALKPTTRSVMVFPVVVFLLGGVIAEGLVMGLVAALHFPESVASFGDLCLVFVRVYVLALGASHIAFNLWPTAGWVGGTLHPTDGLQLLRAWRGRRKAPENRQFFDELSVINELCQKKEFVAALELAEKALLSHPDHFELRKFIGSLHVECGAIGTAEALWRQMAGEPIPSPSARAELLDSLACLAIYRGRLDLLGEAEAWCNQAIQSVPTAITLKGTLGAVLIELGRKDEGVPLLEEVLRKTECQVDRLIASAYFAKVRAAEDKEAEARQWLEKARALDADHVVFRRIESELRV